MDMFVEVGRTFYLITLCLLFCLNKCRSQTQCTVDLDCNRPLKYIKCSICVKEKCAVIDRDIFKPQPTCEYFRDHCTKDYCNENVAKGVVSFEGYGSCVCLCRGVPFYGSRCEKGLPKGVGKFPTGIYFIMPPYVEFNQASNILVFSDGLPIPYIVAYDQTYGGYYSGKQVEPIMSHKWGHKECVKLFANDEFLRSILDVCDLIDFTYTDTVFIIPFVIPFDLVTEQGEVVTSFTRVMGVDAYEKSTNRHIVSSNNFYAMSYPKTEIFETTPIVKLKNCGKSISSQRFYHFKDKIRLRAEIFYTSKEHYSLVKKTDLRSFQDLQFQWFSNDKFGFSKIGYLYWDIPPFYWTGTVSINFTVSGYFQPWKPNKKRDVNFNVCIVSITASPLTAVIDGGSERFVFREFGVTLDASKSVNPNDPDTSSGMYFTFWCNWTHEAVCARHQDKSKPFNPYVIDPNVLQTGQVYNFTLSVNLITKLGFDEVGSTTSQLIVVGEIPSGLPYLQDLHIDCIYNCESKTNPQDIVCLRVNGPWTRLVRFKFKWTCYERGINKEISVTDIQQSNTPSFILILNENTLKENTMYQFKVSINDSLQFAMYPVTTTSLKTHKCDINPKKGDMGLTVFEVSCPTEKNIKLIEFYDKSESDEPGFSGRVVSYGDPGNVEHFQLTRGRLEVIFFDEFGMNTTTVITVMLSKGNLSIKHVESQLADLETYSAVQDVGETLQTASVLSDMLASLINDRNRYAVSVMENLVKFLSMLLINRDRHAKQVISIMHIALSSVRGLLSLDGALYSARTLHTSMEALASGLQKGHLCTFHLLHQIYSRILDCIYIIIETKDKRTEGFSITPQYANPVFYSRVKEISNYVMKTSTLLKSALSYRHLPAQAHKLIEASVGNLSIWIKVGIPTDLSEFTQQQHLKNGFPVIIPDSLADEAKKLDCYLALQFLNFKHNPTWSNKINTKNTFDVSVCFKDITGYSCELPYPTLENGFQVAFDVTDFPSSEKIVNITLTRLDNNLETDWLDLALPVYKIDPTPSADVVAMFNFYSPDTELIVLVEKEMRPTYAILMRENTTVTNNNSVLPVVTDASDKLHFYYLGMQPGAQLAVNKTVSVGIKVYSKVCTIWQDGWRMGGCHSRIDQFTNYFICECNNPSLIGGRVKYEVLSSASVESFSLLPTTNDAGNSKYLCLLLMIGATLLLALVCMKADRHDKNKRFVNVLPDNYPGDMYGFLVRVFTGARIGSGTDAAVGIKIYGSLNDGRSHILSSDTHDVMEVMGEDWFLIFEPSTLGMIVYVDLWHDNAGANPAWFCDSITIYDLHHKNCYFFVVNDWIHLSSKTFSEVNLIPTPFSDIVGPPRVFLEYLMSGFLLSHIWLDIITRHPRDPVTRVDRLAVISCFIVVSMTFSLTVFQIFDVDVEVDDYYFSLTWPMVELGVYSCVVSGIMACFLMHLFRKIYTIIFYIEPDPGTRFMSVKYTRRSLHEDYLTSSSVTALNDKRDFIHYGRRHDDSSRRPRKLKFAEKLNLFLMPKPLVPVQLEGDEPNVIVNRMWMLVCWFTVAIIFIVCVSLTMLLAIRLHPIKSLKWISIVGLAIFIHAIILLPLKITFISALLAVGFKRIIYKDVYTFDPLDALQAEHFGNTRYLANLIRRRLHPMYQPLHEGFHEKHRHKMRRLTMWHRLYELVVRIVFLMVIGTLVQSQTHYQTNIHLKTISGLKEKLNTTDYKQLEYSLEPSLFTYSWYNWEVLSKGKELSFYRKSWLGDYNNRILGNIRLRQFRVKPGCCETWRNLTTDCAAPFTMKTMDTNDYLPFWIIPDTIQKEEQSLGEKYLNEWYFHLPNEVSAFFYTGSSGQTYPSGGYVWDIGVSRDQMEAGLTSLWSKGWIGHYTRAVLEHFNVYNVNSRCFSEVVMLVEQTIAGQFILRTVVQSLKIDITFDWSLVIFIIFTLMLLVRIFILTNLVGIIGWFKNWRYPLAIIMAVTAVSVLCHLLAHLLTAHQYVADYMLHAEESKYFDFHKIAYYIFTSKTLLCTLYVFNLFRFYSLWRFGQTLFRIFNTIKRSMKYIIWVFLIFIFFQLILFRPISYLLLIFVDPRYYSNTIYKYNYSSCADPNSKQGFRLLGICMSFITFLLVMVLVFVLTHQYKATRIDLITHWNVDNFFTFLHEEFVAASKTPVVRKTSQVFIQSMVAKHEGKKRLIRSQSNAFNLHAKES